MAPKAKNTESGKEAPRSQERGAICVSDALVLAARAANPEMSDEDIAYCANYYRSAKTLEQFKIMKLGVLQRMIKVLPVDAPYDKKYVYIAVAILTDKKTSDFQRLCAVTMLDICIPDWRKRVPPSVIVQSVVKRSDPLVRQWRTLVFERDNKTCTQCGETKGRMDAHHVLPWADYPQGRVLVSNGVTLCESCHIAISAQQRKGRGKCHAAQ